MKIDSSHLSKENNKILMNQIYLILMPIAKYLLNSKIVITENEEYPISISLPFNVKKKKLSFLFPNININYNNLKAFINIDLLKNNLKQDDINNSNVFTLAIIITHELFHYLMGDIYLTYSQYSYLNDKNPMKEKRKKELLNFAQDCVNNEILLSIIEKLFKVNEYEKTVQQFKENSFTFETIKKIIENYIPEDEKLKNQYLKKALKITFENQDSWRLFKLINSLYEKNYKESPLPANFESSITGFDINYDFNYNSNQATSLGTMKLLEYLFSKFALERGKMKNIMAGKGSGIYERLIKSLNKSSFYNVFEEFSKLLYKIGVLPDNDIIENPDLTVISGYNPIAKIGYYKKDGIYKKTEYFVPHYYPPKPDDIILYIDISGSIGVHELSDIKKGIKMIQSLYPTLEIFVFLWSTEVFETDKELSKIESTGGTSISCVVKHINSSDYKKYSNIIIFSDGFWETYNIDFPKSDEYKYFFAISADVHEKNIIKVLIENKIDPDKYLYFVEY